MGPLGSLLAKPAVDTGMEESSVEDAAALEDKAAAVDVAATAVLAVTCPDADSDDVGAPNALDAKTSNATA
jgi:hypothetical protein